MEMHLPPVNAAAYDINQYQALVQAHSATWTRVVAARDTRLGELQAQVNTLLGIADSTGSISAEALRAVFANSPSLQKFDTSDHPSPIPLINFDCPELRGR